MDFRRSRVWFGLGLIGFVWLVHDFDEVDENW